MVGPHRSFTLAVPSRTPVSRQAQVLPLPRMVSGCAFEVRAGNAAGPADAFQTLHPEEHAGEDGAAPSQRGCQLHQRDPSIVDAGTPTSALHRRQMTPRPAPRPVMRTLP